MSILYINPAIELITEEDRLDPTGFGARMAAKHGVYLTETCVVRRLLFNPQHPGARLLNYAHPEQVEAAKPSKSWVRRQKRKKLANARHRRTERKKQRRMQEETHSAPTV